MRAQPPPKKHKPYSRLTAAVAFGHLPSGVVITRANETSTLAGCVSPVMATRPLREQPPTASRTVT